MTDPVATADDLEQQAAARRELARIVQQHDRTIETLADRLQDVTRGHEALSGSFDRLAASGTVAQQQRNLITDRLDDLERNLARLLHPSAPCVASVARLLHPEDRQEDVA
jgi:TolA-binding protein